jgi:hypothetical protein
MSSDANSKECKSEEKNSEFEQNRTLLEVHEQLTKDFGFFEAVEYMLFLKKTKESLKDHELNKLRKVESCQAQKNVLESILSFHFLNTCIGTFRDNVLKCVTTQLQVLSLSSLSLSEAIGNHLFNSFTGGGNGVIEISGRVKEKTAEIMEKIIRFLCDEWHESFPFQK